jgi:glycosyltransferase involved in cell wall biosynthesis
MEVLVVDGGSTDGTAAVAEAVLAGADLDGRVINNSAGTTPSNLNAGLAAARGDVLCRVDARSVIPPDYVRLCVETLAARPDVVVTGGAQIAVPPSDTTLGRGIARALNNRLTMGGASYRSGARSGPTDTVYLGAFRKGELRAAGGWNEAMLSNQDFELNRRLGRDGLVWFDSRLEVGYVPRGSLRALGRQYHRFGRWKVRYWQVTGDAPRPRQVAMLLVPALAALLVLMFVVSGRHRLRRIAGCVALGGTSLAAVDRAGSREPADFRTRAVACAGIAATSTGWLSGVAREWAGNVAGRRTSLSAHDMAGK